MSGDAEIKVVRSAAAERMRRYRKRRRGGITYLAIEIRKSEIDGLIRLGFLSAETRNDMEAIRLGLYQYFERTLEPKT